jgi:hypothetical protein
MEVLCSGPCPGWPPRSLDDSKCMALQTFGSRGSMKMDFLTQMPLFYMDGGHGWRSYARDRVLAGRRGAWTIANAWRFRPSAREAP